MKEKKEKKVKKAPTLEEQISLARISAIIWTVLFVIWSGLGVAKIVTSDDWWMIMLDFFVGALSGVDAVLGFIRLKKLKAASESKENTEE